MHEENIRAVRCTLQACKPPFPYTMHVAISYWMICAILQGWTVQK